MRTLHQVMSAKTNVTAWPVLVVTGVAAVAGMGNVALGQVGADLCQNAPAISLNVTYTGNTNTATSDGTSSCPGNGSPDLWYKYTPTAAEAGMTVLFSLCGSGYDTVISVHSGCPGNTGNALACNDDSSCGVPSQVQLTVNAGSTYLIRVAGFGGNSGPYSLRLSLVTPPTVTINTDALTIDGDDGNAGTFFGTPFTTSVVGGVAVFTVRGDLNVPPLTPVVFTGSRPASILVGNDMNVGVQATFGASANGVTPGIGGAAGGAAGGASRPGGNGGSGGGGGPGGGGGAGGTVNTCLFSNGNGGFGGLGGPCGSGGNNGIQGTAGAIGSAGLSGFNSPGSGGAGGTGGAPGIGGFGGGLNCTGAGGNGGSGGFASGGDGFGGAFGGNGAGGTSGSSGFAGGTGGIGRNTGASTDLSGGGAGGGGGSGGAGGGGGGGGGGSGGGGGGGGGATSCVVGGRGGNGGNGGSGGAGGTGGSSGQGGAGGAGGGAFEFVVLGTLTVNGTLSAAGGAGTAGSGPATSPTGGASATGGNPGAGGQPGSSGSGNGGGGGFGGTGAAGSIGGLAGSGGGGGGGGGGTIRAIGTKFATSAVTFNVLGGTNGFGGNAGPGRAVLGSNTSLPGGISVTGIGVLAAGSRDNNIFVQTLPPVPYIAGLSPAAAPYDWLPVDGVPATLLTGLPVNALLAATRVATSTGTFSTPYAGFDYVFLKNVSRVPLLAPQAGFGAANFVINFQRGGWTTDARFGGVQQVINTLQPGEGMVMMVPATLSSNLNLACIAGGTPRSTRGVLSLNGTLVLSGPMPCNIADIVAIGGQAPADGLLTGDDFVAFIGAFARGDMLADIVSIGGLPPPDGIITGDDFNAYIAAFAAGCP